MYHFIEAEHIDFPKFKYGFMLQINNFIELMDYIYIRQIPILGKAFENVVDSINKNYHTNNELSQTLIQMAKISGESIVSVMGKFSQDSIEGQIKCLESGPICFQKSGSYIPLSGLKIISEQILEEFVWPSKKILTMKDSKITKWPGGNHFYVSVDGISLDKYNTISEAEDFVKNYIEKHNNGKWNF